MIRLVLALLLAAPAMAQEVDPEARARMAEAYAGLPSCGMPPGDDRHELHAASIEVSWQDEPRPLTIGLFVCTVGAYNVTHVALIDDGWSAEIAALPYTVVRGVYADETEEVLERFEIVGHGASIYAVNAAFDPDTRTLTQFSAYRGLADASDATTWRLHGLGFVLVREEIDLTFDGASNPWLVTEGGLAVEPRPLE